MKYFRSGKVALPIVGFGFQEMRLGSVNLQQNGSYTFVSSPSPKKKMFQPGFGVAIDEESHKKGNVELNWMDYKISYDIVFTKWKPNELLHFNLIL